MLASITFECDFNNKFYLIFEHGFKLEATIHCRSDCGDELVDQNI